ncbi:MAG: hypothetical protein K9J37_06920 [Saprospiraceae bacterium]|nr:hypothetical protein [Saprospiraceae bacterium]MCF8249627.1 hypothetical protein [Saprospiraceae bacterium]MCF8280437.1 hypothetical protein [Bacteroidales bacterium]MCF8310459.1 hypothetical protein [Saprospiraceae bacterium]MCF8439837.1 hypothetical protein [Saprospiraceae bacterium]
MKIHFFTLFLLFYGFQLFGQNKQTTTITTRESKDTGIIAQLAKGNENSNSDFHDEIGINFTRFLDEAIDFGGNETTLSPYLFTYKRLNQSGDGFRMGAGFDFSRSKGDISGNFFDDEAKSASSSLDLRIGNEHQRKITDRWSYYYGFDGLIGYSVLDVKSSNAKITNSSMYGGIGPVMGAQFMFNERVGLFTEASFYLVQSFLNEKIEFTSSFEEDEKSKSNATNLSFQIPTNIYLFFKF